MNNQNDSSIELAIRHVDAAFKLATTFLAERRNKPFTHAEMAQLRYFGVHLYNRHSFIMQLYAFHAGIPLDAEDERKFTPPPAKTFML